MIWMVLQRGIERIAACRGTLTHRQGLITIRRIVSDVASRKGVKRHGKMHIPGHYGCSKLGEKGISARLSHE